MVRKENTKGFEGFKKSVEELYKDENTRLYILFVGDKDDKGECWCPDCNVAQPFINQAVEKFADKGDIFLTVEVGDKPFWKDIKNPFRGDSNIRLMSIPTLLRWKSAERLEENQCTNMDLLQMFFEEKLQTL